MMNVASFGLSSLEISNLLPSLGRQGCSRGGRALPLPGLWLRRSRIYLSSIIGTIYVPMGKSNRCEVRNLCTAVLQRKVPLVKMPGINYEHCKILSSAAREVRLHV